MFQEISLQMNPKNQLQEYCQKNGIGLPNYQTDRIGGESHKPTFQSSVTIEGFETCFGELKHTKKEAELSAASYMLGCINQYHQNNIKYYTNPTDTDILVYIDLENIHVGDFMDHHKFGVVGFSVIGVATANHPSLKSVSLDIRLLTIESDHKDAADTLMIYEIGKSVEQGGGTYIIVTKDHFAAPLVEILRSQNIKAYRCKSMEELDKVLDKVLDETSLE